MKSNTSRIFHTLEISGGGTVRTKRFLKGALARGVGKIGKCLSYTTVNSYGAFSLSFGLLTLLMNLGKYYFFDNPVIEPSSLIVGAVLAIIGIPLLFVDRPLCIALQDFSLTDYVVFEFLAIKRVHRIENAPSIPIILSVFFGIVPALVGFLFPLKYVLWAMAAFLVLSLSFSSLEFPMVLTFLLAPYLSLVSYGIYIVAGLSVLAFVGYFGRVLIGKHIFHLDVYAVAILIFGILIAVAGFFGYGDDSPHNAGLYLALLLGYYPASGLAVNRRLTDVAIKAIVFSTLPIAVYSLVRDSVDLIVNGTSPVSLYYGASMGGETNFVIGTYLLVSAIFTLMFFAEKNRKSKRVFYAVFFALDVLAILALSQFGVVIALGISLILAALTFRHSRAGYVILPLSLVPYFIPLLPESYLDKMTEFFNLASPLSQISSKLYENLSVALENPILGVGIGKNSYDSYLGAVTQRVDNLFVGIASSVGMIALFVLVLLLAVKFLHNVVYLRFVKSSTVSVACRMTAVAVCTLILQGAFGNIFEIEEIFYIFFVILGISAATLRVAKKENDDRQNYYRDERSSETSSIDVSIV